MLAVCCERIGPCTACPDVPFGRARTANAHGLPRRRQQRKLLATVARVCVLERWLQPLKHDFARLPVTRIVERQQQLLPLRL